MEIIPPIPINAQNIPAITSPIFKPVLSEEIKVLPYINAIKIHPFSKNVTLPIAPPSLHALLKSSFQTSSTLLLNFSIS